MMRSGSEHEILQESWFLAVCLDSRDDVEWMGTAWIEEGRKAECRQRG